MSTLQQLRTLGAFVPDKPIKQTITFKLDGEDTLTADIFVKKLSVGDYEKLFLAAPDDKSRTAKIIADAITLGDDGKEKISFVDAYKLHPGIAVEMVNAFNAINGASKPKN